MQIGGLQKLTLIDYPKKIACSIFLFGCNFKCDFCHNPELVFPVKDKLSFTEEEILDFLEKRKKYLEGVCITGGEPLLNLDPNFLRKIKGLGYFIKIDTNGSFPEKLKQLIDEKLVDFVAMDIKSSKENYDKITNSKIDIDKIEKSVKLISGLNAYEFRTTIIEGIHDVGEVKKIAIWLNEVIGRKPKKFYLQGFKNQRKLLDEAFKKKENTSEKFLNELKEEVKDYFGRVEIRE